MYVHLSDLGNCIQGQMVFAAMRPRLGSTQLAGGVVSCRLLEPTSAMCPARTIKWSHQQAHAQVVSELAALYQQHTASTAGFTAALQMVLGYEPKLSPGEEVRGGA